MSTKTVHIPTISCKHCVATIKRELGAIDGVQSVEGDPATKDVVVEWTDPATWDAVSAVLVDIGYPPEEK